MVAVEVKLFDWWCGLTADPRPGVFAISVVAAPVVIPLVAAWSILALPVRVAADIFGRSGFGGSAWWRSK